MRKVSVSLLAALSFAASVAMADSAKPAVESCDPKTCAPVAVINAQGVAEMQCARPCPVATSKSAQTPCDREKTAAKHQE